MSVEVELAGHGGRVRIEVLGHETDAAENVHDANWLRCRVEVRVRGFEGHVDASFTTQDFAEFSQSLGAMVADLTGEATFETLEEALRLEVEINARTGSVSVTGVLQDVGAETTSLEFSFESDQSFLGSTVAALNEVTRRFPVRTLEDLEDDG